MISDREWDEMRVQAKDRLRMLREEIRQTRAGNRQFAIEGIEDAQLSETAPGQTAEGNHESEQAWLNATLKAAGVSGILGTK